MEESLDEIEEGDRKWVDTVREFYKPFAADLKQAGIDMEDLKKGKPTDETCPTCGEGKPSRSGAASAGSWHASATPTASTRGTWGERARQSPSRRASSATSAASRWSSSRASTGASSAARDT
jgi:hypothetical protein